MINSPSKPTGGGAAWILLALTSWLVADHNGITDVNAFTNLRLVSRRGFLHKSSPTTIHTPRPVQATELRSTADPQTIDPPKPCRWPTGDTLPDGRSIWRDRLHLSELQVGQRLDGCFVLREHLQGTTGPKVYLECGVGRTTGSDPQWHMVNGMMRVGARGTKPSVTNKRVSRIRKKKPLSVYVSRVDLASGRLEVVLDESDVPKNNNKKVFSVSSLQVGQELRGRVRYVESFGVMVDVGANRLGLLHIQKVADTYGTFIEKEKGLAKVGLKRGAQISVVVDSIEKRRLFLDFPPEIKKEAQPELQVGKEVKGTVRHVEPFGVMVDVGGNRQGLLHIQKVADLYGTYIKKEKGLAKAGLEKGARIRVVVDSMDERGLFLDFPVPIKEAAQAELESKQQRQQDSKEQNVVASASTEAAVATAAASVLPAAVDEEAAAWAQYEAQYSDNDGDDDYEDDDDDYDDYDEERDIEDSLGLGTY